MELDIKLEWRPGVQHQLTVALFRTPRTGLRKEDTNDFFPGGGTKQEPYTLLGGAILDGVPLIRLGVSDGGAKQESSKQQQTSFL